MSRAPRPASTICLISDTPHGLEVLMVQRTPKARFMGGAWVFPGGAVDAVDDHDAAHRAVACANTRMLSWSAAAVRELVEETGIWLLESGSMVTLDRPSDEAVFSRVLDRGERFAGDVLGYFANWITPEPLPVRFDTRFFAAMLPERLDPIIDAAEVVDASWIRPREALQRVEAGEWNVAFPTHKVLEFLSEFGTAANVCDYIEERPDVEPIQPRLAMVDGHVEILMPDDQGFADAASEGSDPALLSALESAVRSGSEPLPEIGSR